MQQDRRRNPYPYTWEIPVAIFAGLLVAFALGAHGGRAVANLAAGGGLMFPPVTELFTSLPGLLGGDATAGLVPAPDRHASPQQLMAWVIAAEVLVLAVTVTIGVMAWLRWGPGRMRGMATRAEASDLLGQARLRKNRAVIRPDLYGKAAGR